MYTHYSKNVQAAQDRQRVLMAEAERERRVRQLRHPSPASQPPAARRSRRSWTWQLAQLLRPQAQS
jgi:hypothetical protein